MDNKEELYRNLVILLKIFKNRPYHLAKYLMSNNAFSLTFIEKIINSNKLNEMNNQDESLLNFNDITQMDEYFNSIISDITPKSKNIDDITNELNDKLFKCLLDENYEEAAKIRDYMSKNGIKKKT
jgi:organic radical activating enzyme